MSEWERLERLARIKPNGERELVGEVRRRLFKEENERRRKAGLPVYRYNRTWGVGFDQLRDLSDPHECYRVLKYAIANVSDEGDFDSVDYTEIPVALENLYALACGDSVGDWRFVGPYDDEEEE